MGSKQDLIVSVGDCRLLPSGGKVVHNIPMFTDSEQGKKVNNILYVMK